MATLLRDLSAADITVPAMVAAGTNLFFVARNANASADLFVSDGTDSGTTKLASFPGFANVANSPVASLTPLGNQVFFTVNDGSGGAALWKSNGTAAGTTLVRALPAPWSPTSLAAAGSKLFFLANDGQTGNELWVSDGTAGGTTVLDVVPDAGLGLNPGVLTGVGDTLYFVGNQSLTGAELWRSDGTLAGTQPFDILPGSSGSFPTGLTGVGTTLFFAADNGSTGTELFRLDSPFSTPVPLEIVPGPIGASPFNLKAAGGQLFFVVNQGMDSQLWKSDGTQPGTVLVRSFPGASTSPAFGLTPASGGLYFVASEGGGPALWRSDGTLGGTVAVTDGSGNRFANPSHLTALATSLLFTTAGASGSRLFQSTQGAPTTAALVRDLGDGAFGPNATVQAMAAAGPFAFLTFNQATDGVSRLARTDGTSFGTAVFRSFTPPTTLDGAPRGAASLNANVVAFLGSDSDGVDGLYRTDGTAAGTWLVSSFNFRSAATSAPLAVLNGNAFFLIRRANFQSQNVGLWRSDGTAGGTTRISTLDAANGLQNADAMVVFNGALYFNVRPNDGSFFPNQLWRSDGQTGGATSLLQTFGAPSTGSISNFVVAGNRLFFVGNDGSGPRLWKLDAGATTAGLVTDAGGNSLIAPAGLTALGSTLFVAAGPFNAQSLWRVDPATGVASTVSNGASAMAIASPARLGALGTTTLFFAGGPSGTLWRVGATGNASEVLSGGSSVSNPGAMLGMGGNVYFAADSGSGRELFKSDGTSGGTGIVRDINPNAASSNPDNFSVVGSSLVFWADNGTNGVEPWTSDGTAVGTRLASDINRGVGGSRPTSGRPFLGNVGGRVVLAATDGARGVEPWMMDLAPPANNPPELDPIADRFATLGEQVRFQATASDPDAGSTLTFALVSPPQGAAIDPATGLFTWSPTAIGAVSVTVRVTDNGSPALSATRTFVVTTSSVGTGTTTTISFQPPSITYGQTSVFTVRVSAINGSGTPTGSVTVYNGANVLGTANLSNGQGTVQLSSLNLGGGTFPIRAQYAGDGTFGSSTTQTWDFVVAPAVTVTQLSVPVSSITFGQSITFRAVLFGAGGLTVNGGSVSFFSGNTPLGTANVANGAASLQVNGLAVGSHPIRLQYSGTAGFQTSETQPWSFRVDQAGSTTTLSVPTGPFAVGQAVVLTARVTSPFGTPTGNVTFLEGATVLGTATLSGGAANLTLSRLAPGTRSIIARYAGSATIPASETFTPTPVTVNPARVQSVSVTRSGSSIQRIVLRLVGRLEDASARRLSNYSMAFGRQVGSNTVYDRRIGLASVTYSASANTITINPSGGRINFTGANANATARLVVRGVRDITGAPLLSTTGGTFAAIFNRNGFVRFTNA